MTRLRSLVLRHGLDLLIVAAAAESALEIALRHDADAPRASHWFAVPAAVVVIGPLLARRRWRFAAPSALWLVAAAASFIDGRLVTFPAGMFAAGMIAALVLGQLPDAAQARIGLAVVLSAAAIIVYNDPAHQPGEYVFTPALFGIAWLAGFALRERSAQAHAAEERAEQAEREREAAARIAVAEERARIARELHDIVAHAVSVMVLQVGAVRHRLSSAGEEDREALSGVERTGRAALAEMRRLLGAMRREGEDVDLAPQPGLDGLEPLVEACGRAGLEVRLHVEGERRPLPRAVDLSAYRIVQEGLTNALKHAQAGHADVTLRYDAAHLGIDVRDDGVGPTAGDGLGHGLVGVRERVKIYGGDMSTGRANGGGFELRTRLPLDPVRP